MAAGCWSPVSLVIPIMISLLDDTVDSPVAFVSQSESSSTMVEYVAREPLSIQDVPEEIGDLVVASPCKKTRVRTNVDLSVMMDVKQEKLFRWNLGFVLI